MEKPERLSVPSPRREPPRALTPSERATAAQIADVLCVGGSTEVDSPSDNEDFQSWLDLAVATRSDAFELFVATLLQAESESDLYAWLRRVDIESPETFALLSTVLAGAYLMTPQVRQYVGYPGQHRNPPRLEQAADELSDGILDPVLERGYVFVPTPS
jgi:hypothetical protein